MAKGLVKIYTAPARTTSVAKYLFCYAHTPCAYFAEPPGSACLCGSPKCIWHNEPLSHHKYSCW